MYVADCGLAFNKTKYFENGNWTHIREYIKLNTPGKKDGIIKVWVDCVQKFFYDEVIYRSKYSVGINGFSVG